MSGVTAYQASRIKRQRATQAEMEQRLTDTLRIIERLRPASVRQVYHQAEIAGIVEKTEPGYDKVQRACVRLREHERCPFDWISDATRWMRKPESHSTIEAALRNTIENYRRAVWRVQNVYSEVWVEKDALAGTIYPVTAEYDVPLMVARGYSSLTFLHSAAQEIKAKGKPAFIYQLGDWDPSGQDAARHIEEKLREYAPGIPIHFERLAVTEQQIIHWDRPTRPTKKSDTRAKNWEGDSVELDAIDPNRLRQIVRDAIERHIAPHRLSVIEAAEESERHFAKQMVERFAAIKQSGAL
jgi:hypothetical protein